MLVFPQLATGASALYPVTRKSVDAHGGERAGRWKHGGLRRSGCRDAGVGASGHRADAETNGRRSRRCSRLCREGSRRLRFWIRLETCCCAARSSATRQWDNSPLIQLTPGVSDPLGTTRATQVVNAGSAAGAIAQTLAVPGNFRYTLSVWAKTTAGIERNSIRNHDGRERDAEYRADEPVAAGFAGGRPGIEHGQRGVRGGAGCGRNRWTCSGCRWRRSEACRTTRRPMGAAGYMRRPGFAEDELTVTAKGTDVFDAVIGIVAS